MKRVLLSIIIVAVCFSCNNRETNKLDKSNQTIEDSIKQLVLIRQQDSIERERIFAALGDTVFGTVRYGMSQVQAHLAISKFEKSLKDKKGLGFVFDGYHFQSMYDFVDIENLRKKYIKSYPYGYTPGCEPFMSYMEEFKYNNKNKFYKGRLYSLSWKSFNEYGKDGDAIFEKVSHLIKLFEKKYGKCTEKDLQLCNNFGRIINGQKVIVMGRLAYWEANNKTIGIYLEEIEIEERVFDKELPFKYTISIQFRDIIKNTEANSFIDDVMKADKDLKRDILQKDSVKSANAL
jgi:hypothetical protein